MTYVPTASTLITREQTIHTLDLNFMGVPHAIASYLIPYAHGAVLVESGPGSTQAALEAGLKTHGFTPADVTDVLLTHIHLDHAGASGWLARHGAHIHVHPNGAPHMLNPEKLLASAARIYGEMMDRLWGQFLPVPEDRLTVVSDGEVIEIGHLRFRAIDTPGHADHHYAYLFEDLCFTGDIGGVRLPGPLHLRLPVPPPEFHLEKWRASLERLKEVNFAYLAPTHFGIFSDPGWHLAALGRALDELEAWIEAAMPASPPIEELLEKFQNWAEQRSRADGLDSDQIHAYELANPSWMSPYGIQRYWKKYRSHGEQ